MASNNLRFRLLRADEIDARIARATEKGVQILLYKDARCDMNILDETVGPMNWERRHSRENANCTVAIWDEDKEQWIAKEDTGTESNMEAAKGLASDSFKRACFNWGIGRELYTAPFIWFSNKECDLKPKGGGFACFDRFEVLEIQYDSNRIKSVKVKNTDKKVIKTFGTFQETAQEAETKQKTIGKIKAKALEKTLKEKGVNIEKLLEQKKVASLDSLTEEQHAGIIRALEAQAK